MASSVWGLEAQTDIQKRLADADIGYMRIDLVEPFCGVGSWGYYNNRPLENLKVQEMRKLFHSMGPLACHPDKVIYMAMNPEWFSNQTTPVIAGKYVQELPLLELTPAGKRALAAGEFHPLSGNHRRAALVLYHQDLVAALTALKKEAKKEKLQGDQLRAKEDEIKVMTTRVANSRFWTIQVYNIGTYYSALFQMSDQLTFL